MKEYLSQFGILTPKEIEDLEKKVIVKELKKGEFFIKEGQTSQEVGFVLSGILRSFYHSSIEEEVTYCFTFSNTFVSAYSSFLSQSKTQENIEALTDVTLLSISKKEILALEESSINWLKFFKLIAEQEYINMEKRIFLLQKETAEKRYDDLLQNHPDFLKQIPLQYIASYLGITQRHLSRIRKNISI